jgi:hypothetical protein
VQIDRAVYQVRPGQRIGQNFGVVTRVGEDTVDIREVVQDAAGDWVERMAKLELQSKENREMTRFLQFACGLLLALGAGAVLAQDNAIESISANQQGGNVVLNITMKEAPKKLPIGFSITNPSRIALDFGATANATGKSSQEINLGDVRGVNVVQAGERTRLVLNLQRPLELCHRDRRQVGDRHRRRLGRRGPGGQRCRHRRRARPTPRRPRRSCCATSTSAAVTTAKAGSWSTCRTARSRSTCAR